MPQPQPTPRSDAPSALRVTNVTPGLLDVLLAALALLLLVDQIDAPRAIPMVVAVVLAGVVVTRLHWSRG